MNTSLKLAAIAGAALSMVASSAALAQPSHGNGHDRNDRNDRGNQRVSRHDDGPRWSRGQRLDDRYRTSRYAVNYRRHHLRTPPRGYQWRQVDNNYVLAAIATGLIAEVIAGR